MKWVKFSDKKPKIGSYLITRSKGCNKDYIEIWQNWDEQYLDLKPNSFTHWWEGVPEFDKAVYGWYEKIKAS